MLKIKVGKRDHIWVFLVPKLIIQSRIIKYNQCKYTYREIWTHITRGANKNNKL